MNGVWIVDSRVSVWTLANNEPREWSGMWIIQFLWPGLKLILAWYGAGSEWTRHQENCHKKRVTTSRLETGLVKVPRPQISEHLQLSLKMIRNLSTAKRRSQQTRKKSTCQDLRRWECDGSSYFVTQARRQCLSLHSWIKPDRPVAGPVLFRLQTYANNFPGRRCWPR